MNEKQILVEALFEELYAILNDEAANPDQSCYAVTSVETDLINILSGKLMSSGAKGRPFMERFTERLEWVKFDYEVCQ